MVNQQAASSEKRHSSPLEDVDLDNIPVLKGFADGSKLHWAIAITLAPPGWPEDQEVEVLVQGPDWQAEFYPPNHQQLPLVIRDGTNSKIAPRLIDEHFVLVRVATKETTLSAARHYGRQAVRAALGMLQLEYVALTAQEVLWEGAIRVMPDKKSHFMASGMDLFVTGMTAANIPKRGMKFATHKVGIFPGHVTLALNWYSRAWATGSRIDRFVNLWFAAVVLIDHGDSKNQLDKVKQRERIERHVNSLLLSTVKANELISHLKDSYDIRNEVVHQGLTSRVTADSTETLQLAVDQLIWFAIGSN
jgi:Apea-like HEPN